MFGWIKGLLTPDATLLAMAGETIRKQTGRIDALETERASLLTENDRLRVSNTILRASRLFADNPDGVEV